MSVDADIDQTGLKLEEVVKIEEEYKETDIFLWSNNLVQYLEDIKIDLFFFNKHQTVFKAKLSADVSRQLRPLCIDEILEYVLGGIEKGLIVRSFEEAESEENVLQKTQVKKIDSLVTVLSNIRSQQYENFIDQDHDLKRMKGMIAYCHSDGLEPFYVIKGLSGASSIKGEAAWLLKEGVFKPIETAAALKLPSDNQLLVVGQDIFVFKQSKLKQLFGYDAKATSIAEKKVKEITAQFKLSFAEGADMQVLMKGKPSIIKKLQKIEPNIMNQEDLMNHAEEMDLDLMTDQTGAIIIMDDRDLTKFVNLLNEDYITSPVTGERYEIIKKRPLKLNTQSESEEL